MKNNIYNSIDSTFVSPISFIDVNNVSSKTSFLRQSIFENKSQRIEITPDSNSTRTEDINTINLQDYLKLQNFTPTFISIIQHTTFEDGMNNEAIEIVEAYYNRNSFATIMWINSLYGKFAGDEHVIDSLLRIIAFIEFPIRLEQTFIPMVRAALSDISMNCQESAIMVCETWRTAECLKALEDTVFSTAYIGEYAHKIIDELKTELGINVA